MQKVQIKIPSLIENVRIVESFIDNAKEQYEINDDIYGNIMVAITEAVSNAIQHGNANDRDRNVTITLELLDDGLKFKVEDEGKGFDYAKVEDPTAPENLEKVSGRGIFLMNHLSDETVFLDSGKAVEMKFLINRELNVAAS